MVGAALAASPPPPLGTVPTLAMDAVQLPPAVRAFFGEAKVRFGLNCEIQLPALDPAQRTALGP